MYIYQMSAPGCPRSGTQDNCLALTLVWLQRKEPVHKTKSETVQSCHLDSEHIVLYNSVTEIIIIIMSGPAPGSWLASQI